MSAVWWVRRDLRLADNQTLQAALRHAAPIIPLFILDPALLNSTSVGEKRLAFLLQGLHALDEALRARGSRLVVRKGKPWIVLREVLGESGADVIFAAEETTPYARRRDDAVGRSLPLRLVGGMLMHPPGAILKRDGRPYTVYTPFRRAWGALPLPGPSPTSEIPERLVPPPEMSGCALPAAPLLPPQLPFQAGEAQAAHLLERFMEGESAPIQRYAVERDRLDIEGTSGLSPYLHFGMLSARMAAAAALRAREWAKDARQANGADAWLDELVWREFYAHILAHFPSVRSQSFRPNLRRLRWVNDEAHFAAWRQGGTGYPIVDAAMRQLAQTGWMHNRARMVAASFLVKHLLVDWRWGEAWFLRHLIDGDVASNNGGWQWSASTGTDAAPYFRIFNPILQGKKFDPRGVYVKVWLPELADVPPSFIHAPWEMPPEVQRQARCIIGRQYPTPIIEHRFARHRALDAFRRAASAESPS